jgi:hypothetical protein
MERALGSVHSLALLSKTSSHPLRVRLWNSGQKKGLSRVRSGAHIGSLAPLFGENPGRAWWEHMESTWIAIEGDGGCDGAPT